MITRFERLFTVGVTHAYYDGVCRDFAFTIPPDTLRDLRGGRMIARAADDQLVVLYETDGGGATPLIESTGTRLRFGLQLTNGFFGNITALAAVPQGSARIYRNGALATALDTPDAVMFASPLLSHTLTGTTRPVTVTASRRGAAIRTDTVSSDRAMATFDLRGVDPGRVDVIEAFAGGTIHTTPYYLDPDAQREGLFGLVEIQIAAGFYASPAALKIAFDAKEETLKYYVVVSNYSTPDFNALSVQDAGFAEESRPEIHFSKVLPAGFTADDTKPEFLTSAGGSLVLFKSQARVRRRATGGRKLQLKKNGDAIIENLPQPGAAYVTSDVIVHLSKPKRT